MLDKESSNVLTKDKIYSEKISAIRSYILNKKDWVEIIEIEKAFGLERRGKFIKDDNLSTVAHIINRFLKKEGFKTKRINSEFDYSIWVASPDIKDELSIEESVPMKSDEAEEDFIPKENFISTFNEKDAKKILEIAFSAQGDYDTKLAKIQAEYGEVEGEHTNFAGTGVYGGLNQYILEAFCIIRNLKTRRWISSKKISQEALVKDAIPVEFQLQKQFDKVISYCLYNFSQTQIYREEIQATPSNEETEIKVTKRNLVDVIMEFVGKYNAKYSRIAVAQILTGDLDNDDIIKQSEYYGKFHQKLSVALTMIINSLVKKNRLMVNSKYKLCLVNSKEASEPAKDDDKDFKKIIELITQKRNIFVTGNAGTGKSYLLNKLKARYKKRLELTSTTGLAAVNIKGVTIHSWAGVGICKKDISRCVMDILEKKTLVKKIQKCELLAIDEISMLKGDTFSYIDKVLRLVREIDEPFGGIQLLLFGDFFQLPPVEEGGFEKDFCFETESWKELNLEIVKLETIYRQTEKDFIKALNDIRINKVDEDDIKLLKSREIDYDTSDSTMLHIFSRNDEAENYNYKKFQALDSRLYQFNSALGVYRGEKFVQNDLVEREKITLEIFKKNCRAVEVLALKKGCRVMLLINLDFDKGLINGACGEVVEITSDSVIVRFDNGVESAIKTHRFEYYYNDKLQAAMIQYPLKLAYAITIHKSQGMTLENVVVDCNRIFEQGQTYVALSRVKKLEGLYLKGFSRDKIKVNPKVVDFYSS